MVEMEKILEIDVTCTSALEVEGKKQKIVMVGFDGTVNGVNLTDGLDGLAGSVTVMAALFFAIVAIGSQSGISPVACAVVGALLGFLLFNAHPAAVFMGDTAKALTAKPKATRLIYMALPI